VNRQVSRSRAAALAAALVAGSLVASAGGAAVASPPRHRAPAARSASISVGLAALWISAPIYVAELHGFFAREHLNVAPVIVASTPAMVAAIQSGSMQFGAGALTTEFQAESQGIGLKILAPNAGLEPNLQVTAVAANSPITSLKEVAGKTFCVNVLNGQDEAQAKWLLAQNGVNPSSVKFIAIPFQAMVSALQTGEADVCDVVAPYAGAALAAGQIRKIGDDNLFFGPYGSPATAYFGSARYVATHRSVVERFVAAMMATQQFLRKHPRAAIDVLPDFLGVTRAQAAHTPLGSYPTAFNVKLLQLVLDRSAAEGIVSKRFPVTRELWAGAPTTKPAKKTAAKPAASRRR